MASKIQICTEESDNDVTFGRRFGLLTEGIGVGTRLAASWHLERKRNSTFEMESWAIKSSYWQFESNTWYCRCRFQHYKFRFSVKLDTLLNSIHCSARIRSDRFWYRLFHPSYRAWSHPWYRLALLLSHLASLLCRPASLLHPSY